MKGKVIFKRKYDLAVGTFVNCKEYLIDGQPVSEEAYLAAFPERPMSESAICTAESSAQLKPTNFEPIHSEALAYHPKQIKQAEAHFKKLGIGDTQIDSMGRPVLRDREHRRRVLKALGKVDFASYCGY